MGEHKLCKLGVTGSSPVASTTPGGGVAEGNDELKSECVGLPRAAARAKGGV